MSINNIIKKIKKYLPIIFIIALLLFVILIYILCPEKVSRIIFLSILAISLTIRFIMEILAKKDYLKIDIKDKKTILKKIYKKLDLDKTNNIIAIYTKDENIVSNTKKLFPGSKKEKQKNTYSILLPDVELKTLLSYLKNNDPDRIIIHQFMLKDKDNPKSINRKLSICIDKQLFIKFPKNSITKEEKQKLKEDLS